MEENSEGNIVLVNISLTSVVLQRNLLLNLMEILMVNIIEYKKMNSETDILRALDS